MSASTAYRSELGVDIARYITGKRALGRDYARERDILRHLDHFLAGCGQRLSAETFAAWCATIGHLSPTVRRYWMRVARNLCLYRRRSDPECFVPDASGFPAPHQIERPHLLSMITLMEPAMTGIMAPAEVAENGFPDGFIFRPFVPVLQRPVSCLVAMAEVYGTTRPRG